MRRFTPLGYDLTVINGAAYHAAKSRQRLDVVDGHITKVQLEAPDKTALYRGNEQLLWETYADALS